MVVVRCVIKAVFVMLCLMLPAVAVCADSVAERDGTGKSSVDNHVAIKKKGKKGKAKKPDLNNPDIQAEIAKKAIAAWQADERGIDSEQDGEKLELPVKGRVTSKVGLRPDPINGDIRMHNGIDIAIPEGTPVKPVAPGRIAYSGLQPGYGNMVIVQHDDGMISVYAHHSRNLVKTGDRVARETRLALSGSTGHSTGPHLHFEAWQGGMNVTSAFLPNFAGHRIDESTHGSLETTNLHKVVMSDGTILFVEVVRRKK